MNKAAIVALILEKLDAELDRAARAARDAQAGATDEQSKAENKYDTRGLEASYLAHGQSRQALETVRARRQIAAMSWRDFSPDEPIEIGALIEVENAGERWWYLLAPGAGGMEVFCGAEITVITPASPVGREVMGKRARERGNNFLILRVE